jgi:hypothetical protein
MRAELWTAEAFVAAFDMPPFNAAPTRVDWNARSFVLIGSAVHTAQCDDQNSTRKPANFSCACDGGAFAYRDDGAASSKRPAFQLQDMHRIEAGRDKPLTKKPKATT